MAKVAKAVIGGILVGIAFLVPGAQALAPLGWSLIVSNALDVIAQSLADKPRLTSAGQDIEFAGTVEPRRIIYGQQKVSGMNVIEPMTSGANNQNLHQVLAIAGHEVSGFGNVFFGKEEIDDADIQAVGGGASGGRINDGKYALKGSVRRYVGTSTQSVDFILNAALPTQWTTNHRLRGNAYAAMTFMADESVYDRGKPEVSFMVLGKKCYDPQLDPEPGVNTTTASYIAYTTNAALCAADYLLNFFRGTGIAKERIDWDLVVAAAQICDENVLIPPASPVTTQKRYTCNVTMTMPVTDEQDRENLKTLATAMMGHVVYRSGQWRMYAGAVAAPSFALTESDISPNGFTLRTETPANEKYNRVRGQFIDSARDYQLVEFEPRINSAYELADGGGVTPLVLEREILLVACDNQYEAQRDALITLDRSRRKKQLSGTFGMGAFKIRPWDVGTMTLEEFGWDEQPVRCIAFAFNQEGTIDMTLMEEDDADWADPAVADYTIPGAVVVNTNVETTPDVVPAFTVVGAQEGIWIDCDYPANFGALDYFRVYIHTAATPFSSATVAVAQSKGNRMFISRTTTATAYFWVSIVRRPGANEVESEERPSNGAGVPGASLSIASGFRVTVNIASHYKELEDIGTGTTNYSSTVTPINQSAAPTYAWTRIAGSTELEAISTTSATTFFRVISGQSLANLDSESSTFRCTVTSSGASPTTATIDVVVTFSRDDNPQL